MLGSRFAKISIDSGHYARAYLNGHLTDSRLSQTLGWKLLDSQWGKRPYDSLSHSFASPHLLNHVIAVVQYLRLWYHFMFVMYDSLSQVLRIERGSRHFALSEFGGLRQTGGHTFENLGTWHSLNSDPENRRRPMWLSTCDRLCVYVCVCIYIYIHTHTS